MRGRLPPREHEWIDRSRELVFTFEGRGLKGFAGDTISSALCANGVKAIGRSFKYHRARGVYSLAGHDANGLFTDGIRTNIRGDLVPLQEDLNLKAVNTFGGLTHDRMKWAGLFAKCMPVGFYYKTFFRPRWMFPFHERILRSVAGLGKISPALRSPSSPKEYAWSDVLVVGGGLSGMSSAIEAAEAGASVLLVEENQRLGGSLSWEEPATAVELIQRVEAHSKIEVRCGTTASGIYKDRWVALVDAQKLTKLRTRSIVLATGAIEQPAVFQNNDLPGVMLASAAQRLISRYAVKPFDRAVLVVANSEGYRAALDLQGAEVEVVRVLDLRPGGEPSELAGAVAGAGISVQPGYVISEAGPAAGGSRLAGVSVCPLDDSGNPDPSRVEHVVCDGVGMSVGWMPNLSLACQGGIPFRYDSRLEQLVPGDAPRGIIAAGRLNGVHGFDARRRDGEDAGRHAAAHAGFSPVTEQRVPRPDARPVSHPYPIVEHKAGKNFVDLDEDLHVADFRNAHAEGYDSIELMKRYSTFGMGPSQGKLANMNAVRIVTKLSGNSIDDTGMTTARPFYQPVPVGHLAGRRFHAMRHTPMHDWHAEHDAEFVHAGSWYRAEYYRGSGADRASSILSEATTVRNAAGLIDISTLGKIFVNGADSASFLERIYTGRFSDLAPGRQRYAVALDESGIVIEDGLVVRLADDVFYVTATSSGAAAFYREMQRWALVWGMNVTLINATGQYAAMNLAGPASRDILSSLTDVDLSADAFPYLGAVEGAVAGVRVMLLRVGFVGELGFELHVPASQGMHIWQSVMEAGASHGLQPFGLEAQRLLRLEKSHLIISQDTDALTNVSEAGLAWSIARDKEFFVGKRSTEIMREKPLTRKLVGLRWPDGYSGPVPEECHLMVDGPAIVGRVTSVAAKTTLGYPLGLGMVHPDRAAEGSQVTIRVDRGGQVTATVVTAPHYDPENARQA